MILFKKILFLLLILLFADIFAYSTDGVYLASDLSSMPTLRIDYDAKSTALAGIFTGISLNGSILNPANSAYELQKVVGVSYRQHILAPNNQDLIDIRGGTIHFGAPVKTAGVLTGSLNYFSYGKFDDLRDENNMPIDGVISPFSTILSISFSRLLLDKFALGITIKGLYEKISDNVNSDIVQHTVSGAAVDIGWQYRNEKKRLIYGVTFQDIGAQNYSYQDGYEVLPFTLNTGLSFRPAATSQTMIAVDLSKSMDDYMKIKLGLDIDIFRSMAFLRAGFKFSSNDVRGVISNISTSSNNYDEGSSISSEDSFSKSDWSLLSLGFGVNSIKKERDIEFNMAFELHVKRIPPSMILSLLYSF